MWRLTKAQIGYNGLMPSIVGAINGWQPPLLKTELAFSDALCSYLRENLPDDSRVEREYRHDGTTCDVCVIYNGILADDRVLIEVKRNLNKKADYDRLVGQVEGLRPKKNKIAIVLVGDTDPALVGRLQEQFSSYIENGWI